VEEVVALGSVGVEVAVYGRGVPELYSSSICVRESVSANIAGSSIKPS